MNSGKPVLRVQPGFLTYSGPGWEDRKPGWIGGWRSGWWSCFQGWNLEGSLIQMFLLCFHALLCVFFLVHTEVPHVIGSRGSSGVHLGSRGSSGVPFGSPHLRACHSPTPPPHTCEYRGHALLSSLLRTRTCTRSRRSRVHEASTVSMNL